MASQKLMSELFQTTTQNITIHLKNIFEEGELNEEATCKDFLQVQNEGNRELPLLQYFPFPGITSLSPPVRSSTSLKYPGIMWM
jgi:hypothetical protein